MLDMLTQVLRLDGGIGIFTHTDHTHPLVRIIYKNAVKVATVCVCGLGARLGGDYFMSSWL